MENKVREGIVPTTLHMYRELASCCCHENDEIFVSLAVYSPVRGENSLSSTQITINGATYALPIGLTHSEVECIKSELVNLGATVWENASLPAQYDYKLELVDSFGVFFKEAKNLYLTESKNVIKK